MPDRASTITDQPCQRRPPIHLVRASENALPASQRRGRWQPVACGMPPAPPPPPAPLLGSAVGLLADGATCVALRLRRWARSLNH